MRLSKKSFVISAAGLFILAAAGSAVAQDAQDKNWSVTLGLKAWGNVWDTFYPYTGSTFAGDHVISTASDMKAAVLPSLTYKYKSFFVNGGAFTKTSYDFGHFSQNQFANASLPTTSYLVTDTVTAKRSEEDLNLGWYLVPQLAVTVGYKQVKQEYSDTTSSTPVLTYRNPFNSTTTYKILTIGAQGSARLGDSRLFMYGSAAYGPHINVSFSPSSTGSDSGWYMSSEVGLGYAFSSHITGTAGYKTQIIHQKTTTPGSPDMSAADATYGFIAGLNLTF